MNYQHGDVLLKEVKVLPKGLMLKGTQDVIVAEGELTGHSHKVQGKGVQLLERAEDKTLFLNVIWPSTITHQEHQEIEISPGLYEIGRIKEYDYFEAQARLVRD